MCPKGGETSLHCFASREAIWNHRHSTLGVKNHASLKRKKRKSAWHKAIHCHKYFAFTCVEALQTHI